jgi:hypothetical protein
MGKVSKADQRAKDKFNAWYEKNREDYNAQRRKKYSQDQELRKKARENARKQRQKTTGPDLSPVKRLVHGRKIAVYRVSAAAENIGRSPETIRTWIRNGWLPEQEDGWTHRTFTKRQMGLMKRLGNVIDKYRYADDYHQQLEKVVEQIRTKW